MTGTHFAEGEVLFREGDTPDCVFRVLRGAVDILRELDGEPIILGRVGAGQFIGEMGVVENRSGRQRGRGRNPQADRVLGSHHELATGRSRTDSAPQSATARRR